VRVPAKIIRLRQIIQAGREERAQKIRDAEKRGASALTIRARIAEFERYEANAAIRISNEITPVLDAMKRRPAKSKRMPRDEVQRLVAKEYQAKGRSNITARRVKAYWTEHNNFVKASHKT
jgi:hypothetical protein